MSNQAKPADLGEPDQGATLASDSLPINTFALQKTPGVDTKLASVASGSIDNLPVFLYTQWIFQKTIVWKGSQRSGTMLYSCPIHPFFASQLHEYFVRPYNIWSGGICFAALIAANNFKAGKLMLLRLPPEISPEEITSEFMASHYSFGIVDARTETPIGETVIDQKRVMYHRVHEALTDDKGKYVMDNIGGHFCIFVAAQLVVEPNSIGEVDIKVYSHFSPDFQANQIVTRYLSSSVDSEGQAIQAFNRLARSLSNFVSHFGTQAASIAIFAKGTKNSYLSTDGVYNSVNLEGNNIFSTFPALSQTSRPALNDWVITSIAADKKSAVLRSTQKADQVNYWPCTNTNAKLVHYDKTDEFINGTLSKWEYQLYEGLLCLSATLSAAITDPFKVGDHGIMFPSTGADPVSFRSGISGSGSITPTMPEACVLFTRLPGTGPNYQDTMTSIQNDAMSNFFRLAVEGNGIFIQNQVMLLQLVDNVSSVPVMVFKLWAEGFLTAPIPPSGDNLVFDLSTCHFEALSFVPKTNAFPGPLVSTAFYNLDLSYRRVLFRNGKKNRAY